MGWEKREEPGGCLLKRQGGKGEEVQKWVVGCFLVSDSPLPPPLSLPPPQLSPRDPFLIRSAKHKPVNTARKKSGDGNKFLLGTLK